MASAKRASPKSAAPKSARRAPSTARNFEAGRTGRRLRTIPTSTQAINSLIRTFGKNVVARSRYLAVNNPYAVSAKEEFIAALVGNGIKPSSLIGDSEKKKAIAEAFSEWTDEADADGLTDFYGLQAIIASEMFEAGECFVRFRERFASDGLTVPLQMQLLPSEMLPTDHNEVLANGRGRIECGIEFDAIGRRMAYWFLRRHPGDNNVFFTSTGSDKVRVPATEVLHLFRPIRAGQLRGIPHTLSGMVTLAMLDLYDDAELERKRIAALFGAFVTRPHAEEDEEHPFGAKAANENAPPDSGVSDFSLEPGAVIDLGFGQDVKFAEPADVGSTYEAFQYRNLLRAAAGFGGTYSGMTGDLRQTSYGSIRAGLVAFRRRVEAIQHHVMVFQLCRAVWLRWFPAAVLAGAIEGVSASEFVETPKLVRKVKWIPPKWDWVDPLKDRQAEKLAVDSGFKPRSDVIEAEGYDPEEVDDRIRADQTRATKLGIKFVTLPSSVLVAPDDTIQETPTGGAVDLASEDFDFG